MLDFRVENTKAVIRPKFRNPLERITKEPQKFIRKGGKINFYNKVKGFDLNDLLSDGDLKLARFGKKLELLIFNMDFHVD